MPFREPTADEEAFFGSLRKKEKPEEPKATFSDDLIAVYTAFRDQVYNPRSVLHPSCGFDASPARVFGNVTFVDLEDGNEGCIAALKKEGLTALKQDILCYTPKEQHDLLILLNPAIPTEWASRHIISGGYVLTNDYHGNASQMHSNPDMFTLWGTIGMAEKDMRKRDNSVIVSRDLDGLFVPVRDAEEFRRFRPDDYEFTKEMVISYIAQGIVPGDKNAPFEEKWAAYREALSEAMPSKRVADYYVFLKK